MNRTPFLATFSNTTPEQESVESQKYFASLYPGVKYIKESDSFEYRGLILDYFKSGIRIPYLSKEENGFTGSYLLVDPENYRNNWLFTYGPPEEMWNNFYKKYQDYRKPKEIKKLNFSQSFFRWLFR